MKEVKKKILFLQSSFQPPGGAQCVAVWMLEALKNEYDITTLTSTPINFSEINNYYGTSLRETEMTSYSIPRFIHYFFDLIPNDPFYFQKYSYLMRWCKMISRKYDIIISANNETDFGGRGIQYIHYPYQEVNWVKEPVHFKDKGWCRYALSAVRTKIRPWRIISGFSFERMRNNLSLVNSNWTGAQCRRVYGIDSIVVYPPVPGDFPNVPWEKRENGFVCIGRISGEKKYEDMIDILAAVRKDIPDIHLHIIGSPVDYDLETYRNVKRKVQENTSWVSLNENLSRDELVGMVSRHRYGIHGTVNEHFGIAVAELVSSGCITFVPDSGGQVEIIGDKPGLLYHESREAVKKILDVLNHRHVQTELYEYIKARKGLFTTEKFMRQIREIIREFAANGDLGV